MTGVRMAAFDLDGTLLEHGALTQRAVRMLQTLRQNGIKVVIATGRHRGTVPPRLHDPRLVDYLICSCGAVICAPGGEALWERTLSAEDLKALMALGQPFRCTYAVSLGRTTFLSRQEPLRRQKTDGGSDTKKYFWRYWMYPLHSRRLDLSWAQIADRPQFTAEKVLCATERQEDDLLFRAAAEADGRFTATGSNRTAEITARGVSKGNALRLWAQRLKVPREAIAAFGNDDNDLSLQAAAGRFIVPKASSPAALLAADRVVDSIPAAALELCIPAEGKEAKQTW